MHRLHNRGCFLKFGTGLNVRFMTISRHFFENYMNIFHRTEVQTHAIINRGLYIFYPIFHCGLYCRGVNITDNLCTKKGNSSFFKPKILGLYTRAVTDQKLVIMARVWYHFIYYLKQTLSAQPTITASYL